MGRPCKQLIIASFMLAFSAWGQGLPEVDFKTVKVQLDQREYPIRIFPPLPDTPDRERVTYYSPLFLFVERPNRYGTHLEMINSVGTKRGQNILFFDFLVTNAEVDRQIRRALDLNSSDRLEPIPFYAVDVKLKVPGVNRWIRASNPHEGDVGLFGKLVRIGFFASPNETVAIENNLYSPGIQFRIRTDYFSVKTLPNKVTAESQYIFPDGVLDQLFQGHESVTVSELQLRQLLSEAYRDQKVKGLISDSTQLSDVLAKIPLLEADLYPLSSSGKASSSEFVITRADLERVSRSILDLTTYDDGISNLVFQRNTQKDRIQAPEFSSVLPHSYERRQPPGSPVLSRPGEVRKWTIGSIEVVRPSEGQILISNSSLARSISFPLTINDRLLSVMNAKGEGCIKILIENISSNSNSLVCIDSRSLNFRYQRFVLNDLGIEAIMRPNQLKFQQLGNPKSEVVNFSALEGAHFLSMDRDPQHPNHLRIRYSDGQFTFMEVPKL